MATVETELPSTDKHRPYRLSASAFFQGLEHDVFPEKSRLYLWDGVVYEKMAKKIAHAATSETTRSALLVKLPPGWSLWGENPILVDDFTAPLPDLAIVRGTARDYFARGSNPGPAEIGVVIELSDATLREDQTKTLTKYASANLPIYWLINLLSWRVEVYSSPGIVDGLPTYCNRETYELGQDLPLVLDGIECASLAVAELLPLRKTP